MKIPDYLPVNRGKNGDLPVNEFILAKTKGLLEHMARKHGKVLPVRFDVRYPECLIAPGDNKDISRMMTKLRQKYSRKGLDPHFIWVRENKKSDNQHYHCTLLLNGNKTQRFKHVFANAERLWGSTIGSSEPGLIHHCTGKQKDAPHRNGIMIVRAASDFEKKYQDVHHQISYLAKASGKGSPKDGLRDFGMSRIPNIKKEQDNE